MKILLGKSFVLFLLFGIPNANGDRLHITSEEVAKVREKLEQYSKGNITLEEATDGEEWGKKVIAYHLAHSNEISTKMKLPIARCYAIFSVYTNAARLVSEYLNVYTNDGRAWDLLAGAKAMQGSVDEAVTAWTNAVRFGYEMNIAGLGGAALMAERMDVVESLVAPRLLVLKNAAETPDNKKRDMISVLVAYSFVAMKREMFVKALEGADVKLILADPKLRRNVETGCKEFGSQGIEEICNQVLQPQLDKPAAGD